MAFEINWYTKDNELESVVLDDQCTGLVFVRQQSNLEELLRDIVCPSDAHVTVITDEAIIVPRGFKGVHLYNVHEGKDVSRALREECDRVSIQVNCERLYTPPRLIIISVRCDLLRDAFLLTNEFEVSLDCLISTGKYANTYVLCGVSDGENVKSLRCIGKDKMKFIRM